MIWIYVDDGIPQNNRDVQIAITDGLSYPWSEIGYAEDGKWVRTCLGPQLGRIYAWRELAAVPEVRKVVTT